MSVELNLEDLEPIFEKLRDDESLTQPLQQILKEISKLDENDLYDFYTDSCDYFSEWVNDSDFRWDEIGESALTNPEIFRLILEHCCPWDQNIEVVLVTSPHCPEDVLNALESSDFVWEEDGTTQAMARNSTNPDRLSRLSENEDDSTRFYVAQNSATPEEVLDILADDEGWCSSMLYMRSFDTLAPMSIQYAVAHNPNTSKETLLKLSNSVEQDFQSGPRSLFFEPDEYDNFESTQRKNKSFEDFRSELRELVLNQLSKK